MGERIRENTSTALFRIIMAITILVLILSVILGNITSKPTKTQYIYSSYCESLKSYYLLNTISQCLSVFFVCLLIVCILTALVGHKVLSLVFLGISVIVFGFFFFMSAVPLFAKPRVETVNLKHADFDTGNMSANTYTLYFDNGTHVRVPSSEYEYGSKQKKYYLIMCGNKPLEAYSAKDYSVLDS